HSHLQRVAETLPLGESSLSRFKGGGRKLQECLIVDLAADDRVRTYQDAFPALDAEILIPYGHLLSKIALFQTRSPGRKRAISRHSADRNFVAATNENLFQNIPYESGRSLRRRHPSFRRWQNMLRNCYLNEV